MAQIFKNNTWGLLASQLTAGATSATLSAGHNFTDPGTDWYLATLIGVTGTTETAWEIVKVTDVSTNTLTIVRAQEGTSDATWPAGTRIELRLTAGATESKANLGAAAYKAVGTGSGDVAAGNRGVTNGDSHDHNGGDGGQIAYSSLSGLPTLGTAAAAATTDFAAASHNQAETTITFTDISTGNASTTAHGYAPKATAPASGLRSVLAIDNGETVRTDKALFDATNPAALGTASPGSAMTAARRDHVHPLPSVREQLTANRTYYVRTDGNDANTGLANTSGGAFLTIQKAVDVAASLDVRIYNVTISVGTGTFDGAVVLKPYVTGGGLITIEGSATPANHILTNSGGSYNGICIFASSCGNWRFYGVRISVSASGHKGIDASGLSRITINTVDFTGGLYAHLYAIGPASIYCENGYSISGGVSAGRHIDVRTQGVFSGYGTITLTGTPDFDQSFVFADVGGAASFDGISFSGSATGSRYSARAGGIVATFGGETYLPGDSAGTTSSGGIYA